MQFPLRGVQRQKTLVFYARLDAAFAIRLLLSTMNSFRNAQANIPSQATARSCNKQRQHRAHLLLIRYCMCGVSTCFQNRPASGTPRIGIRSTGRINRRGESIMKRVMAAAATGLLLGANAVFAAGAGGTGGAGVGAGVGAGAGSSTGIGSSAGTGSKSSSGSNYDPGSTTPLTPTPRITGSGAVTNPTGPASANPAMPSNGSSTGSSGTGTSSTSGTGAASPPVPGQTTVPENSTALPQTGGTTTP